ncbi:MAG: TonB-dependent receptor plug domain-containing protein, partial [Gammaproteobacteria bacterium]|nr:TonB-dependent receptor plug domain-containing protein [Gammaproteobacteria bacterium]
MKASYLSLVIASVLSGQAISAEIQELATTVVKVKAETVTAVTAQQLENIQVNDLKGTLSKFSGVSVSNSSRYSQKTYLRGVEEHSANVTLDGARQDGQMFHHSGNQMIDTSMLKSVSVELGASSVLSGYGANVGAISYQTKDPRDLLTSDQKFGYKVLVAADTATDYRQVNFAGYGLLTDKLGVLAIINKDESGDIKTPNAKPIVNKHGGLKSALVKVVYDFNENEQLDLSIQHFNDSGHRALSGEKPGATNIDEALGFNGYERDTLTANYSNHSDNPLLDLSATAYFNEKRMVRSATSGTNWFRDAAGDWHKDGVAAIPAREYSYKTIGLDIRNTMIVNDIPVTVGIESFKSEQAIGVEGLKEITHKDGTKESADIGVYNGPTATLIGGYVQAEFVVGALQIIPGIRFDSYSLGGTYDDSFSQASPKLADKWQVN